MQYRFQYAKCLKIKLAQGDWIDKASWSQEQIQLGSFLYNMQGTASHLMMIISKQFANEMMIDHLDTGELVAYEAIDLALLQSAIDAWKKTKKRWEQKPQFQS